MASEAGVTVQTVKLKVLYTFDADYRDNHLARCPQSFGVNTCFIDSTNQIGLVDLRTCLDAVTAASPELLSRLDTDYAVYAFDYSEEDAPLVGQGLLTKHVSAQDEPAGQEGEAMVTGRITTGLMGLLSKNSQPTLEVKLRLKPVTAFASQRTRSGSLSSQDGRIPQWLSGSELSLAQGLQRPISPMHTSGLETVQRMLSEGGPPRDRQSVSRPDGMAPSRPGSRAGTPSLQPPNNAPQRSQSHARRDSFNSGYYSGEDYADDGPVRKRAKTTKVDWPSKSDLNIERQPDSLRVAASIASSVRLQRPVAINPTLNLPNENANEELVRPPTPVPVKAGKPRGRPKRPRPSKLSNEPGHQDATTSAEVLTQPELRESAVSSPEDLRARSAANTPANIPSSPPIMTAPQMATTASPGLAPMLNNNQDSGFMSGGNFDHVLIGDDGQMFNFDDFVLNKNVDQFNGPIFGQPPLQQDDKHYGPVFDDGSRQEGPTPEPAATQPKEYILPPPPPRPMSRAQSFTPGLRADMSSPKLAPAPIPRARQIMDEQRAKGWPTQLPQSEPGRLFHRSNTWAPDGSDALMPEHAILPRDEGKQKPKKRVGKAQTKARLETAIAAGEMPPYCDNCGAIETPAWRRAWTKTFTCSWEEVDTSLVPGELCWKEATEYNEDGVIVAWKGLKAEKRSGDEDKGWSQINLCNPCGLWFHKQKCPRPKEKWEKGPKGRRRRRGGAKALQVQQKGVPVNPRSDAPTPMSDESSPTDTAADDNDEDNTGEDDPSDSNEPQLPAMPQHMRSSSAEPAMRAVGDAQARRPFPRQVHSSPARGHGSEADPVEIDLTPKPLRRQLFPSPDKLPTQSDPSRNSTTVHMVTKLPAFVRRSPRLHKTKDVFQIAGVAGAVAITADGKENMMPEVAVDEMYDALFNETMDDGPQPPTTPARRSERILAKTPQQQFGADLSPNVRRSPFFRTPGPKNATHPALAALIGTAKKGDDMTPFSKAIQDAWDHGGDNLTIDFLNAVTQRQTPKKAVPNKAVGFDFPDLPSLKNSSPMTSGQMFNMDLSELPTDQLQTDLPDIFSTDAAMPSSPPGFYNFLNSEIDLVNADWTTEMESASLPKASVYHEADDVASKAGPALRRSPRQHKK
ncbi:hypothetical protein DV736_g4074, partial [Chaetothyriales sp. CBS 134916]